MSSNVDCLFDCALTSLLLRGRLLVSLEIDDGLNGRLLLADGLAWLSLLDKGLLYALLGVLHLIT